jgi:hypothetical protein
MEKLVLTFYNAPLLYRFCQWQSGIDGIYVTAIDLPTNAVFVITEEDQESVPPLLDAVSQFGSITRCH